MSLWVSRRYKYLVTLNVSRDTVRSAIYWTGVNKAQNQTVCRPQSIGLATSSLTYGVTFEPWKVGRSCSICTYLVVRRFRSYQKIWPCVLGRYLWPTYLKIFTFDVAFEPLKVGRAHVLYVHALKWGLSVHAICLILWPWPRPLTYISENVFIWLDFWTIRGRASIFNKRKRKRSDSILWQKPLHTQKKSKKQHDNTKTPPKT